MRTFFLNKLFLNKLLSLILLGSMLGFSPLSLASSVEGAAEDFTLKSKSGSNIRLQDLRGEVVLLNFWASWCGPCREEMPLMDKIYQQYKDLGFTILAVNVDEDPADADRFLAAVPVSFPVVYDSQSKVSEMYKVDAMPTTILIDRDGRKRFLHRGYKVGYEDEYEKQVKQLVRE